MSYNNNFYNIYGNSTFQDNHTQQFLIPPPPPPPAYFIQPLAQNHGLSDQAFIKQCEKNMPLSQPKAKPKLISISEVCEQLKNALLTLNDLKIRMNTLSENMNSLSEEEWRRHMKEVAENKTKINELLTFVNEKSLDTLRKLLSKRTTKRLRLKRVKLERKREREERIREMEENSRKIDENLQKIKDDINKAKQEEQAKIQADAILKEVLRKKTDAKKCIVKLDALLKLRKARENTAKGRGEKICEKEAATFSNNIEKLKSLWTQKFAIYEKEEMELRAQLKQDSGEINSAQNDALTVTKDNLTKWQEALFGGSLPQANFEGDVGRFVAVRSQWDNFLNINGSPLPIGWVTPSPETV